MLMNVVGNGLRRRYRWLPSIAILELADLDVMLPYRVFFDFGAFFLFNSQLNFKTLVLHKFLLNRLGIVTSIYHKFCCCS